MASKIISKNDSIILSDSFEDIVLAFDEDFISIHASMTDEGVLLTSDSGAKILLNGIKSFRDIPNLKVTKPAEDDSLIENSLLTLLGIVNVDLSLADKGKFLAVKLNQYYDSIQTAEFLESDNYDDYLFIGQITQTSNYVANKDTSLYQNIIMPSGWTVTATDNSDKFFIKFGLAPRPAFVINELSSDDFIVMEQAFKDMNLSLDKSKIRINSKVNINFQNSVGDLQHLNFIDKNNEQKEYWQLKTSHKSFAWTLGSYIFDNNQPLKITNETSTPENDSPFENNISLIIDENSVARFDNKPLNGKVEINFFPDSDVTLIGDISTYVIGNTQLKVEGGNVDVVINKEIGLASIFNFDSSEQVTISNDNVSIYSFDDEILTRNIIESDVTITSVVENISSDTNILSAEYVNPNYYRMIDESIVIDTEIDRLIIYGMNESCKSDEFIATISTNEDILILDTDVEDISVQFINPNIKLKFGESIYSIVAGDGITFRVNDGTVESIIGFDEGESLRVDDVIYSFDGTLFADDKDNFYFGSETNLISAIADNKYWTVKAVEEEEQSQTVDDNLNDEQSQTVDDNSNEEQSQSVDDNSSEEQSQSVDDNSNDEQSQSVDDNSNEEQSQSVDDNSNDEQSQSVDDNSSEEQSQTVDDNSNEEQSQSVDDNSNDEQSQSFDDDEIEVTIPPVNDDEVEVTIPPITDDEVEVTTPPINDDEIEVTTPPINDDEVEVTSPPITDDEIEVTIPPITDDEVEVTTPPITDDEIEVTIPPINDDEVEVTTPPINDDEIGVTIPPINDDESKIKSNIYIFRADGKKIPVNADTTLDSSAKGIIFSDIDNIIEAIENRIIKITDKTIIKKRLKFSVQTNFVNVYDSNRSRVMIAFDDNIENDDNRFIIGNYFNDRNGRIITGGKKDDTIFAGGNDTICPLKGKDLIKLNGEGTTINLNGNEHSSVTVEGFSNDDIIFIDNLNNLSYKFINGNLKLKYNEKRLTFKTETIDKIYKLKIKIDNEIFLVAFADNDVTISFDDEVEYYYGLRNVAVDFGNFSGEVNLNIEDRKFNGISKVIGGSEDTILKRDNIELVAGRGATTLMGGNHNKMATYEKSDKINSNTFFYLDDSESNTIKAFDYGIDDISDELRLEGEFKNYSFDGNNLKLKFGTEDTLQVNNAKNEIIKAKLNGRDWIVEFGDNLIYDDDIDMYGDINSTDNELNIENESEETAVYLNGSDEYGRTFDGRYYYNIKKINASNYKGRVSIAGADNSNESIQGGKGKTSLWGGLGGDDTLRGGTGQTTFFYLNGDGDDVIQNAKRDDVVDLFDISLADIDLDNTSSTSKSITVNFNTGGSLKINGEDLTEITFYVGHNDKNNHWKITSNGSWKHDD